MPYLKLKTQGRRTGLTHVVELRYVLQGGSLYVISGSADSDWVLNAVSSGSAVARIGELSFEVSAEQATEGNRAAAYEEFRKKFGRRFVDEWYGGSGVCLRLTPRGAPKARGSADGELNAKTSLGEWRKQGRPYYGEVAAAFDSASDEYDFTISRNFINTWIRQRSIEALRRYIEPSDVLLEIGSGTGTEAIEIVRWVGGIVAIDISEQMVDLLRRKARAKHLEGKIQAARLGAAEVSKAEELFNGRRPRVAYSFNGALNCEPNLEKFVQELHRLLLPGGYLVCSVRNTFCLSEALSHAAAIQFSQVNPRRQQPIMVSVGGRDIPSFYYSPATFLSFFRPWFRVREMVALPGLLPPAYLNDYYLKLRRLTSGLERLDESLSRFFPLNRVGDQTLFVLQRDQVNG